VIPAAGLGSWASVRDHSHNDFEPVVAGRLPEIGHWLDRLRETEAFLVRLAGSGGAIVALFESVSARDAAWSVLGAATMLRASTLTAPPMLVEDA
jgi:4-diphosphocytidyl-2C-methyl-D-erythritol kinase